MRLLIKNGLLIDPKNRIYSPQNLLLDGNKVAAVTAGEPAADQVIDAAGQVVCPGFLDIHMHEDPLEPDGSLYADEEKSVLYNMLRMGVTTAVAGNCGENRDHPLACLDAVDRQGAPVNLAMLAGHGYFRVLAGAADKYAPATEAQIEEIGKNLAECLDKGCLGVSFGIRYIPGMDRRELLAAASPCERDGKLVAAHIRDDADAVLGAAREFLDIGLALNVPLQLSHIGSMAGFGQMARFLALTDEYRAKGVKAACDCYPYDAFSTDIGETTYDDGWLDRYGCDYSVVEMAEGKYKGRRLTRDSFEEMRREHPEYKTICHVMQQEDVDLAYGHPGVFLGSDATLSHGQGHPRAAGSFPRFLGRYVRAGKISLYDAISRVTGEPAAHLGLAGKGHLAVGADADVVIFDPAAIIDRATFPEPLLPPAGVSWVIVNGVPAAHDGAVLCRNAGRSVRR